MWFVAHFKEKETNCRHLLKVRATFTCSSHDYNSISALSRDTKSTMESELSESRKPEESLEAATKFMYAMMATHQKGERKATPLDVSLGGHQTIQVSFGQDRPADTGTSDTLRPASLSLRSKPEEYDVKWEQLEPMTYIPLPKDGATIRLLKIERSNSRRAVIKCKLEDISLNDKPEFAAISYVWGPPVFDCNIICNGQSLAITETLHYALARYREDMNWFRKDYIWTDAICINQEDEEERNSQVLLMGRIYREASMVHINLGGVEDAWAIGWYLLQYLHNSIDKIVDEL